MQACQKHVSSMQIVRLAAFELLLSYPRFCCSEVFGRPQNLMSFMHMPTGCCCLLLWLEEKKTNLCCKSRKRKVYLSTD